MKTDFDAMNRVGFGSAQMRDFLLSRNESLVEIGKTSFFKKVLKASGYRFRKLKTKFGIQETLKKECSKHATSVIIADLMKLKDVVYFYDESTFSMNDYKGKYWTHKKKES